MNYFTRLFSSFFFVLKSLLNQLHNLKKFRKYFRVVFHLQAALKYEYTLDVQKKVKTFFGKENFLFLIWLTDSPIFRQGDLQTPNSVITLNTPLLAWFFSSQLIADKSIECGKTIEHAEFIAYCVNIVKFLMNCRAVCFYDMFEQWNCNQWNVWGERT